MELNGKVRDAVISLVCSLLSSGILHFPSLFYLDVKM